MDESPGFFIAALIGATAVFVWVLAGYPMGYDHGQRDIRMEAVGVGAASFCGAEAKFTWGKCP